MESISLKIQGDVVKIYINGYLHLSFRRSSLSGIQAFKEDKGLWSIEYTFKDSEPILTEYDTRERWLSMLTEIDKGCLLQLDKV